MRSRAYDKLSWLGRKIYKEKSKITKYRREQLSEIFDERFDGTVAYGPFTGLQLSRTSSWSPTDRASMLFGLYEQELLLELATLPAGCDTFIDLGAADGYYAVGAVKSGLFARTYAFEITPAGQAKVRENAERNGVSDRVHIFGEARKDFARLIPPEHLKASVLFVDIEGAEFDIFDRQVLSDFRNTVIFFEIHDFLVADSEARVRKLREDASEFFDIREFTTAARDLSRYPELRELNDTDRWLVCSEGRKHLQTWWRLDPKPSA